MHNLERSSISRRQTGHQVATSISEVLDKIDERFDRMDARIDAVDARIDAVDARIDSVEKSMKWLSIQGYIGMTVMGLGFVAVIITLLNMN